jgi:Trk K+ transport system NAD-binding subunit
MEQPVILCGLGRVGRRVLDYLHAAGVPVVVVDNRCRTDDPHLGTARLVRGDCQRSETLEQAGIAQARGVLILTSDDYVNISTLLMVRHLHPEVRAVVRLFNQNLIHRVTKVVTNTFALGVSALTAPLLTLTALTGQALGTFNVEDRRYQVADLVVLENSPIRGRTVAEITAGGQAVALAHLSAGGKERFLLDVDPASRLETGDRLVVCGEAPALATLLAEGGDEGLPHLLWAGWMRRFGRMAWRTLAEVDLPVKICTGILVGVLLISTVIYSLGMHQRPAVALFRTISLIATGAAMHDEELDEDWQKVFASTLRIIGAVLLAAFTAIFTNYLLRVRLRGTLEIRRIPDGGHVIVCGLGNVGFRVVEELLQYGERVVIVETQRDGRYMAAARQLDVAILVGDATVLDVLRQAHAATARAVVAATSNELANLEIALLVRELNPRQRVVVRLSDTQMPQILRDAANIRFALSLPDLAAPAFVAAIFGERVPSVFLIRNRLMAVVELVTSPSDLFLAGQPVQTLAADYRLLPVCLVTANGAPQLPPADHHLVPGDKLTVITALSDLQRLLRRERQ